MMIEEYTKEVMHDAIVHHMSNGQPVREQCSPLPPWPTLGQSGAWCHMVWDAPLASLCQQSWFCPLPAPYAPLAPWQGSMRS